MAKREAASAQTNGNTTATPRSRAEPQSALEQNLVAFAEQVGRFVGTVQARSEEWLTSEQLRAQMAAVRDGHEPERNARVLGWRKRAHDFGLVPVEDGGAVDSFAVVEPADRLIREEEPEAFDDQPVDEAQPDAEEVESDAEDDAADAFG